MSCFPFLRRRRRRPADPPGPGARGAFPGHSPGAAGTGTEPGTPGVAGKEPRTPGEAGKEPGKRRDGRTRQELPEPGNGPGGVRGLGKDSGGEAGQGRNGNGNSRDTDTGNGNVPRARRRAPFPPQKSKDVEPNRNSQKRDTDTGNGNGNVPRARRRAPLPPRRSEDGEPSGNSRDTDTGNGNGNVPRMDQPRYLVPPRRGEDEDGEPSRNSQNRDRDTDNGNMTRARRRAPLPPRRSEDGEPSGNSRDTDTGNGNVPRMDRPPVPPRRSEDGEPSGNSRDTDTASPQPRWGAAGTGTGGHGAGPESDIPSGIYGSLLRMLRDIGNAENADEDSDSGVPGGINGSHLGILKVSGNTKSVEEDLEQGPGATPERQIPGGIYGSLLGLLKVSGNTESAEEDAEQGPGATPECQIPSGINGNYVGLLRVNGNTESTEEDSDSGIPGGIYGSLLGMLRDSGNTESAEEDSDQGPETSPEHQIPGGIYGSLLGMLKVSGNAENAEEDLDSGVPGGIYGSHLGMLRVNGSTKSMEEDSEQGPRASPERQIPGGINESHLGLLRVNRNTKSAEDDLGSGSDLGSDSDSDSDSGSDSGSDSDLASDLASDSDSGSDSGSDSDSGSGSGSGWGSAPEPEPPVVHICRLRVAGRLERQFPAVWARSRLDCGRLAQEERLSGAPVPFQPPRPLSPRTERRVAELLPEYLRRGIIVEGASSSNNPLILLERRGRGSCLSLDCAALAAATPAAPRERPDRDGILTSINPRSRFFSVLDLCSACFAVPLAPECRGRFGFTFRGRQFQFARLPPTFRDAPSIVQRRVAAVLRRLEPGAALGVFHYADDILIAGKRRRQAEHRTRRVLALIQSAGFKVNRAKAQLLRRRVDFLGRSLGHEGRRPSAETLRRIRRACEAAGPWEPARLRSVLGKFGDVREFIPDYWELALPLQRLAAPRKRDRELERELDREWEQVPERLRRLREALEAAPALQFPDKSRPFVIRLSVHARTVGAVLLQDRAGALLPVRHSSRRLGGRGLASPDAACLAAIRDFQKLTGTAPVVIHGPAGRFLVRGLDALDGGSRALPVATVGPEPRERPAVMIPVAPELCRLPAGVPRANVWFLAVGKGTWHHTTVGFAAGSLEERWLLGAACGEDAAALEALRALLERHRGRSPLFLYAGVPGLAARLRSQEPGGGVARDAVLRWLRAFPGMLRLRQVGTLGETSEEARWIRRAAARANAAAEKRRGVWKGWEPTERERREIVALCH